MNKVNINYHPNKKKAFIQVFGLLIISFLLVYGGLIFRNLIHHDYPLVFVDSNNKLMYITKSDNNKNDIASIENANIVYANNDSKYLLYTNNNSLYLLDTTVGEIGTKIVDNPIKYGFSSDDKYVYYIDSNNAFYLYKRDTEENLFITNNVLKVETIKDIYVLFNQDNKLVYYNLDSQESKIISDTYKTAEINDDNHLILYSVLNNNLKDYFVYNINNAESNQVLTQVDKLYSKDTNYTKFIYTIPSTNSKNIGNAIKDESETTDKQFTAYTYEDYTSHKITKSQYEANQKEKKNVDLRNQIRDYIKKYLINGDDLYYQNGTTKTLVSSNINKLYYYDIKNQRYSYTTNYWEANTIDISSYDDIEAFYTDFEAKKLNTLYFKVSTNQESMAYKNITTTAKVIIRNNDEYYLLVQDGNYYNLYYSKISNKQIKLTGEIDTNLLSYKLKIDYVNGYLYSNYINGHYYLDLVESGKVKTITEDINPKYVEVSEGKDSIYYIKSTGDNIGDLMLYNGIRTSTLAENVYSLMYINNDLIYVTKNYDAITKTSDLYRYNNNHLTLIYKNIADWYSPLKTNTKASNNSTSNADEILEDDNQESDVTEN
jgi:hypothetical protein